MTPGARSSLGVLAPALGVLLVTWSAVHTLIRVGHEDAARDAYRDTANLALAFEEHTVRTLRSTENLLQLVARDYAGRGVVNPQELADLSRMDRALLSVAMLDTAGNLIGGSHDGATPNFADRDYFRHHLSTAGTALRVGVPIQGRVSGQRVFPVSRRVDGPDGSFRGVAAAGLNPDYFGDFYGRMDIRRDGMVLLVGLDGVSRARRSGDTNSAGQDMRGSTLLREAAKQPIGSFLSVGRIEGVHRYTSYRTVPEYGLVVAVGISREEALHGYYERRAAYLWSGGLISALVLAFAALAIVFMSRRREAQLEHQRDDARFRATFDEGAVAMAHVDLHGRIMKVNRKLCAMTGYADAELVGRSFLDFKFPEERLPADEARRMLLQGGSMPVSEHRYRRKDGGELWANTAISLVRAPDGRPDYFIAVGQDITEQKRAQAMVEHQATHDLLTNLPNRILFQDRLEQALHRARRRGCAAGVMYLDLDRFKQVNDTLGHAAGDALLREVASRLAASLRTSDTAARLGGDEFAAVLGELAQPGDAAIVAAKVLAAMAAPMSLEGHEYVVTVSIGIALFPADGDGADALLRRADAALFRAKGAGRNCFRFHDPAMDALAA